MSPVCHLLIDVAYRPRYGRGRAGGEVFYLLFRWLYSVIGAWSWAVWAGFVTLCVAISAVLKGGSR